MDDVLTACMVVCTALNSCNRNFCKDLISINDGALKIRCDTSQAVNLADAKDLSLKFDVVQISRCSLQKFTDEDGQVLRDFEIKQLNILSTRLVTLSALRFLDNNLQTLVMPSNSMDNSVASTLPALTKITFLSLANNQLTYLPTSLTGYTNLEFLKIHGNSIVNLDITGLSTTLKELDANRNQITTVNFSPKFKRLKSIDLSENYIDDLWWLTVANFPASCQRVNLKSNGIEEIMDKNINFLTALKFFDASNNRIKSMSSLATVKITDGQNFNLANNPVECSCSMAEFGTDGLWSAQFLPTCASPVKFQGLTVQELAIDCQGSAEQLIKIAGQGDKSGLSAGATVVIIVGVACLVGGMVAVGVISQRRRVVIVEETVQRGKDRTAAPNFSNIEQSPQSKINKPVIETPKSSTMALLEAYEGTNQQPVDQYVERRRLNVTEAEDYVLGKLKDISAEERELDFSETIEVCLELTAIQTIAMEAVDVADLCSLMVKEWPIAPCNTPMELYMGMYYEGDMEEWPMTALNTRTCSISNIDCILDTANQTLQDTDLLSPKTLRKNYLSTVELRVPPNSVVTLKSDVSKSATASSQIINDIGGW